MNNFIQLNESNILKLKIKTADGKETGEFLEFDLEDIELPLKFQDLLEQDKKNKSWLKNQIFVIDKRQDVKGKKLMSKNEEDKIRAVNDFFKKEIEVYDGFLGKDGVKKLLNGRKLGWTSLQEIDEIINKQIMPHIEKNKKVIEDKIREKYNLKFSKKSKEVL